VVAEAGITATHAANNALKINRFKMVSPRRYRDDGENEKFEFQTG
jgi:hypothetical protein